MPLSKAIDHAGAEVSKLGLPVDSELRAEHRADLLGGVTVLLGQAVGDENRPIAMTAVPYYACANRGKSAMTVWVREPAKP